MTRFVAPPPPPPPPPEQPVADPAEETHPEETSVVPDEGPRGAIAAGLRHKSTITAAPSRAVDAAGAQVEHGPFTITGETVAWRCIQCGTPNHIDDVICSACGGSFATTVAEPELRRPSDPNTAALLSLLFPGIGHAYLGDWGAAVARFVLSVWVGALALVMVTSDDIPGSMGLAIVFVGAAVGLWVIAAHDAFRSSAGHEAQVVLRGRRYLYVTIGLLGTLFMGLMLATFASR